MTMNYKELKAHLSMSTAVLTNLLEASVELTKLNDKAYAILRDMQGGVDESIRKGVLEYFKERSAIEDRIFIQNATWAKELAKVPFETVAEASAVHAGKLELEAPGSLQAVLDLLNKMQEVSAKNMDHRINGHLAELASAL